MILLSSRLLMGLKVFRKTVLVLKILLLLKKRKKKAMRSTSEKIMRQLFVATQVPLI